MRPVRLCRDIISGIPQNAMNFYFGSDIQGQAMTFDGISEIATRCGFDIESAKIEDKENKEELCELLKRLLLHVKKRAGDDMVTVDSPALQLQAKNMMCWGLRPDLCDKMTGCLKSKYTYDEPAKAGRESMTYRELLFAITESENQFRPLTHW